MISNIAFTGRETLLTKPVKEIAKDTAHEFFAASTPIPNAEKLKNMKPTEVAEDLNNAYRALYAPQTCKQVNKNAIPNLEVVDPHILY